MDPPENAVVCAERGARLAADGGRHLFGRVGVEAWRHLQDALERGPSVPLAVVEARPLERLLGEHRHGRRECGELVVDRPGTVEQELDRAVRLSGDPKGNGHDRSNARREDGGAVLELALERFAVVRPNQPVLANCGRENRAGPERDASSRDVKACSEADRLHDEYIVALEQARVRHLGHRTEPQLARPAHGRRRRRTPRPRSPRSASAKLRRVPASSQPRTQPRSPAAARDARRPRTRRSTSPRRD